MTVEQILKAPEGRMLEFKREMPKDRLNLLKTIVGFSNGSGGHIYIGINDNRSVCGIKEEPFELEQRLSSLIYDSIAPTPNVYYQTSSVKEIQAVLLKEQGTMGSKAIAKYLEIHQNTALKRLRWLEQKGIVHRQGRGTKVRYRPK